MSLFADLIPQQRPGMFSDLIPQQPEGDVPPWAKYLQGRGYDVDPTETVAPSLGADPLTVGDVLRDVPQEFAETVGPKAGAVGHAFAQPFENFLGGLLDTGSEYLERATSPLFGGLEGALQTDPEELRARGFEELAQHAEQVQAGAIDPESIPHPATAIPRGMAESLALSSEERGHEIAQRRPPDNYPAQVGYDVATGLARMAPSLALSRATGSPNIGLGAMFGDIFGQEYQSAIHNEGKSHEEATLEGAIKGGLEVGPERLFGVFGRFLNPGPFNRVKQIFGEGGSEAVTEIANVVDDAVRKGESVGSLPEILQDVGHAFVVGVGMGGLIGPSGTSRPPVEAPAPDPRIPRDIGRYGMGVMGDVRAPIETADPMGGLLDFAPPEFRAGFEAAGQQMAQHGLEIDQTAIPEQPAFAPQTESFPITQEAPDAQRLREDERQAQAPRFERSGVETEGGADLQRQTETRAEAGQPEGLILKANGQPYFSEQGARRSMVQRGIGGEVTPVEGGFAIQPTPAATEGLRGQPIDDEWTAFSPEAGGLNVPRAEMPQVKAEHRGALANFLKGRGIEGVEETVPAASLKPTQTEFSEGKVEKAKAFEGGDRAILVSSDGHVVDGHHQWIASVDKGEDIRVIRLQAPIADLLGQVKQFPSVEQQGGQQTAPDEARRTARTAVPDAGKLSGATDVQAPDLTSETTPASPPSRGTIPPDQAEAQPTPETPSPEGVSRIGAPIDQAGSELVDLDGAPVPMNEDGTVTLYHRTTPEAARQIRETGRFVSAENTQEAFFSTAREGQAEGYGPEVVELRVNPSVVRLDDAFRGGEVHVAANVRDLSSVHVGDPAITPETAIETEPESGVSRTEQLETSREIRDRWRERGVDSSISERGGIITLNDMVVPEAQRGQGIGSEFMRDLADYADRTGQRIGLTPSADRGASSVDRLRRFYRQFGFKPNRGRDKDFEVSESMVRVPEGERYRLGETTPEWQDRADDVWQDLRLELDKMRLQDVKLRIPDEITSPEGTKAAGRYFGRVIDVALNAADPTATLNHESIHAIRDLGLFDGEQGQREWRSLERRVNRERMAGLERRYGKESLSREELLEEGVADMYAEWRRGDFKPKGLTQRALQRVQNFFESLGNALRGNGFQTAEDVFGRIESGEVGDRQRRSETRRRPRFSRDSDWGGRVMPPDDTFESAAKALVERGDGYVEGALTHPRISGAIDLVWGREGTPERDYEDGFGLAKIIRKHPEVDPSQIQDLLFEAKVIPDSKESRLNRIKLESDTHNFVVAQEWRGDRARWLLTAFDKRAAAPQGRRIDVAEGTASERPSGQEAADTGTVSPDTDTGQPRYSLPKDPDLREAMQRAGLGKKRGRLSSWVQSLQQATSDGVTEFTRDLGDSITQGTLDRFHGIKRAEQSLGDLPAEQSGYVAARLSTGIASTMRGILNYGSPRWADGIIQKVPDSKGLLQILEPVQGDLNTFLGWMVGNRARRLKEEGRERLFEDRHIDALVRAGEASKNFENFEKVAGELDQFKKQILDVAEEAGLIDPDARSVWDHADYIPFYRVAEQQVSGPRGGKGLSGQTSGIRTLKGGTEALNDPLENLIMNFTHLMDASMKNHAIRQVQRNLGSKGILERVPMGLKPEMIPMQQFRKILTEQGIDPNLIPKDALRGMRRMYAVKPPQDHDVVRIMDDGKAKYYRVTDPLLLRSLTAVHDPGLKHPMISAMRGFKRILTRGVTADPAFMARNFLRDALHAWTINPDKFRLGVDSIRGVTKTLTETGGAIDMMFAGGSFLGGYVNATDPGEVSRAIRIALRQKGFNAAARDKFMSTVIDTPAKLWEVYTRVGDAIENASRESVFEAGGKAGKPIAQRVFEAKDLMDYSMRGDWAITQFLTDVIPFLNARAQGLYKLGRAGFADPKRVAARGSMISLASLALLALNHDDERYEELPDWDKDTYWHIYFPESVVGKEFAHIRIPKPFEIGVIFGTVPERIALNMLDHDDTDKTFERFLWSLRETFAFDPVPQAFNPMLEIWGNRDRFRDAPIEGLADEGKLKEARYSERTSETMRALGRVTGKIGLSPKQLEHIWRGYTGQLGMYALDVADVASRATMDLPPKPARRIDDYPVVRSFIRAEPARGTKYSTELYDLNREISQIYRTIRNYRQTGDEERARKILERERPKLQARSLTSRAVRMNSEIRDAMDKIYRSEKLSPAEKRQRIDRLMMRRNELNRRAMTSLKEFFDQEGE